MSPLCVHTESEASSASLSRRAGAAPQDRAERLLFIVPGFPADERDSSCLPAVQTYVRAAARLVAACEIRVLALHYPFEPRSYLWHGIEIISMGAANRGGWRRLNVWRRAIQTIARRPPDVIHSFWVGECALLGALAARRLGCGHVSTVGGQELRRSGVYSRLLRLALFRVVAGSSQAAETVRRTLHREVDAVIPIGLDPTDLPPPISAESKSADRFDVLFAGSFNHVKRPEDVLAVARSLPSVQFGMAGGGPLWAKLQVQAPPNVTLTGHLPREQVLRLMRSARILLHPADFEGQGYVFLEALACGMRVVCRDAGSPGRSDHVHRCRTTDEMSETIARLLRLPEDRTSVDVPHVDQSVDAYAVLYGAAVAARYSA